MTPISESDSGFPISTSYDPLSFKAKWVTYSGAKFSTSLLVVLLSCMLQGIFVHAAHPQERVFINDRWPIDGPNGPALSPPHIQATNECSESVYVYSFVPKATITVLLNGTTVIGGPVQSTLGFMVVNLTKRLQTGDKITAIQEVNGLRSAQTQPPMFAGKMPVSLPAPTIDPHIYACGLSVPVHDLVPGVTVEVSDVTSATLIGKGALPNLWGSDWDPVSTSSLVRGHILSAQQSACTGVKSPETVTKPPVLPNPTPLTAPNLDQPIVGNDAITAHGLFNGSVLKAFQGANIGTGVSTAETNWMQVSPRVAAVPPAPKVTSDQSLCTTSPPSPPAVPTTDIPPPVLLAPICPGQGTILVRNSTIDATLVLLQNNQTVGYGGAAPGDVPMDITAPAVLSNGDTVRIAEYIGDIVALSAPINVNCFQQNVVTQHNNNQRTGAQLAETKLTPASVKTRFALRYDRAVLGTVMAQPLYVHGVKLPSLTSASATFKNLVYVATSQDIVYAFDADDESPDTVVAGESTKAIWRRAIGTPHAGDICDETNPPVVGITGTPVIDVSSKRLYVVARDQRGGPGLGSDVLHALDIETGADLQSVVVNASAPVNPTTTVDFNPTCERQRPGLLLQNGNVYIGYGTYNCDSDCPDSPYRGWIIGFRGSDLTPAGSFTNSLATAEGGMGVWASGNGLAGNKDGSAIFYQTGNDKGGSSVLANGDAFMKLTSMPTSLSFASRSQAQNADDLRAGDTDLGAGGPMLLPGGKLVGGGKDGRFYLLSQTNLASGVSSFQAFFNTFHFGPGAYPYNNPPVYTTDCPLDVAVGHVANKDQHCFIDPALYTHGESYGPNIHGGPVYWASAANHGFVYKMAEKDYLKAFAYDELAGTLNSTPAKVATIRPAHDGMPGGFSSISASGTKNGIVWTVVQQLDGQWGPPTSAILYAFDARTLDVLWSNSGQDEAALAKFNSPTIADGRVFLPSVGHIQVYGLALRPFHWRDLLHGLSLSEAIQQRWQFSGGAAGTLGAPLENQTQIADDAVTKGLHTDYAQDIVGGGYGNISLPASVLIVVPMCKDPDTQKKIRIVSSIYASRQTGAHIVRGEIRRVFLAEGGVRRLGYPLTDEVSTADGFGLMTRFERGTLVWYPGKPVVHINRRYRSSATTKR